MIRTKQIIIVSLFFLGFQASAQLDELTPEEQAYRDSITALNLENEAIANSQEAYNSGIKSFQAKKFNEAIAHFSKSIQFDPNANHP